MRGSERFKGGGWDGERGGVVGIGEGTGGCLHGVIFASMLFSCLDCLWNRASCLALSLERFQLIVSETPRNMNYRDRVGLISHESSNRLVLG